MALTAEQVRTQNFTYVKFRDGYDPDEVDDFLDKVEADLRERDAEKTALEEQIKSLQQQLADVADAPAAQPAAQGHAEQSTAMLQLAQQLHDQHVSEGQAKHDEMVADAESKAKQLVEEAQNERADVLRSLEVERGDLTMRIEKLREFEDEYRSTLRSYIQGQLRDLESNAAPNSAETPESE